VQTYLQGQSLILNFEINFLIFYNLLAWAESMIGNSKIRPHDLQIFTINVGIQIFYVKLNFGCKPLMPFALIVPKSENQSYNYIFLRIQLLSILPYEFQYTLIYKLFLINMSIVKVKVN